MLGKVVRESKKDIYLLTPDGKVRLHKDAFETLPPGVPIDVKIIVKPKRTFDKLRFGVMKD
jgi:hypothetical protein